MSIPCTQRTDHSLTLSSWANNTVLTSLLTLFPDYWHFVLTSVLAFCSLTIDTLWLLLDYWHVLLTSLLTSVLDYWHILLTLLLKLFSLTTDIIVDITTDTLSLDCWHSFPWLLILFSFPWPPTLFSLTTDTSLTAGTVFLEQWLLSLTDGTVFLDYWQPFLLTTGLGFTLLAELLSIPPAYIGFADHWYSFILMATVHFNDHYNIHLLKVKPPQFILCWPPVWTSRFCSASVPVVPHYTLQVPQYTLAIPHYILVVSQDILPTVKPPQLSLHQPLTLTSRSRSVLVPAASST